MIWQLFQGNELAQLEGPTHLLLTNHHTSLPDVKQCKINFKIYFAEFVVISGGRINQSMLLNCDQKQKFALMLFCYSLLSISMRGICLWPHFSKSWISIYIYAQLQVFSISFWISHYFPLILESEVIKFKWLA